MPGMEGVSTPKIPEQIAPSQAPPARKLSLLIKKGVKPSDSNENTTKTIKDVTPKTIKDLSFQLDPQNPLARKESFIGKLGIESSSTPVKIGNFIKPLLQPSLATPEEQKRINVRTLRDGAIRHLNTAQLELIAKDATPALKLMLRTTTAGTYKKSLMALQNEEWKELYQKHDGAKLWLFMGSSLGGEKPEMFQYLTTLQDVEKKVRNNPEDGIALYHQLKNDIMGQRPFDPQTNRTAISINIRNDSLERIHGQIDEFINAYGTKLKDLENKLQKLEIIKGNALQVCASNFVMEEAIIESSLLKFISPEELKLEKELSTAGSSKKVIIEDKLTMLKQLRGPANQSEIKRLTGDIAKLRFFKQKEVTRIEKECKATGEGYIEALAEGVSKFNQELLLAAVVKDTPFDGVDSSVMPNLFEAIDKYK